MEAYSASHGKASAYLPVIEMLHGYFGVDSADDGRKRREKVIGKLIALDPSLEDTLPYLFVLLGILEGENPFARMDLQTRRRRTQEALKRIVLRESLNHPVIVVFEDLHWVDGESQAWLNLFADSIANARVLLLVNYRPEYRHEWGNRSHYTQLRLDPLVGESAEQLLSALLGEAAELAALRRLIAERTEGNPFFVEEMVRALFDDGTLARNGAVKLIRPLTEIKAPATVRGIVASRIDRLPADEKDLLQTLAVIGREFPLSPRHAESSGSRTANWTGCFPIFNLRISSTSSRRSPKPSTPSSMRSRWRSPTVRCCSDAVSICTNARRRRSRRFTTPSGSTIT